jgi:hypothetical protein
MGKIMAQFSCPCLYKSRIVTAAGLRLDDEQDKKRLPPFQAVQVQPTGKETDPHGFDRGSGTQGGSQVSFDQGIALFKA